MPLIWIVSYSKSGCSQALVYCPNRHRQACVQTGLAFLFSLVLSIYVDKQRYQQSFGRYQQCQYPQKNHNNFIVCHQRHLPSDVSSANHRLRRLELTVQLGRLPPRRRAFPYKNFNISRWIIQERFVLYSVPSKVKH